MKSIFATAVLVALVVAEPPSSSYLPPSSGRSGYPRGGPNLIGSGVIAARSQHDHENDHFQASPNTLGFGRGAQQGHGHQSHGKSGQLHGHNSLAHGLNPQSHGLNPQAHGLNSQAHGLNPQAHGLNSQTHGLNSQGHGHGQHSHTPQVASARFSSESQGYDRNASPFGRNGDSSGEPASYNFEYAVSDLVEGTDFGHHEERQDERAEGQYHVVLPDGRRQTVSYEADERGFKPHISYEDTDAVSRANGYDSNANNLHGKQAFKNGARNHGNGY